MAETALEEYKGYLIAGSIMISSNSREWSSLGYVYSARTRSPLAELKRIEGPPFNTKEEALQHGIILAKRWVDEQAFQATSRQRR